MNANGFDRELGSTKGKDWGLNEASKRNSQTKEVPYKVREFEWFEVETKIRKFVNELLQPTIMKISLEKKLIEEVTDKIEKNNEQVRSLYEIIHYNDNKVKVFDDIYEKIAATNTSVEVLSNKHKQQQEKIEQFEQHILQEFTNVKAEVHEVQKVREQFEEDKHTLMEYFENFKKNTQQIISSLTLELSSAQNQQKLEFQKTWDSISKIELTASNHQNDIIANSNKITDIFERISAVNIKNAGLETSVDQINKEIEQLEMNISLAKKFTNKVEDLQNKFSMVENYVEKYSGLFVQGQISDTLFSCLDRPMKKKLVAFEEKIFASMNQRILNDDGSPNLAKKIEESVGFIETIVKRNAKFLHLKKRDSIEDVGEQLTDSMNKTQQQLTKENSKEFIRTEKSQEQSQQQQQQQQKTIQQQQQQQQQLAMKVLNNTGSRNSVNSGMSASHSEVSGRQFNELKKLIDMEIVRMKEQLNIRASGIESGLLESEQTVSLQVQLISEQLQSGLELLRKEQRVMTLESGAVEQKVQSIWTELSKIVNTFNVLSETVHKLIHFNTLTNSLLLQDELDKQTIALFGYKTTFTDKLSTITKPKTASNMTQQIPISQSQLGPGPLQLDERCLSCSGQTAQIAQTFKIACLAYHPSSVIIDGQSYKREEILEVSTRLLQAARQQYGLKDNPKDLQEFASLTNQEQNRLPESIKPSQFDGNQLAQSIPSESPAKEEISKIPEKKLAGNQSNSKQVTQTGLMQQTRNNTNTTYNHYHSLTQPSNNITTENAVQSFLYSTPINKPDGSNNYIDLSSPSPLMRPKSNLPQLDGLKPRSRAFTKKPPTQQQQQQRLSSSLYNRRENTQQ